MATYAENLITERNQIQERLVEMTAAANPTVTENGKTWDWNGWYTAMTKRLAVLNELIQQAGGPFIVSHRGR